MEFDIKLSNYRCFTDERPATVELRRGMTALIGPNNSGKSALLRFFYEFRHFFDLPRTQPQALVGGQWLNVTVPGEVLDFEELFSFTNEREIQIRIVLRGTAWERWPLRVTTRRERQAMQFQVEGVNPHNPVSFPSAQGETFAVFGSGQPRLPLSELQVALTDLCDAVYIGAFRNALNRGGDAQKYFDVSVGQQFISEWSASQTGNVKRLNRAARRVVDHVQQIFGFRSLEITAAPKNQSLNFVVNGRTLKDYEVGSGLTQVLMVLATVAIKQPSYILIDEPELNLHPSLQVKFLMALASYAREGILFGTHSIGLARTVADRIFSVQQAEEGRSEIRKYDDTLNLAELLGEMSFSAYKDMGFEKILLVEGRTDVRTVQQFLRLLKKDQKVVPVPLGGSSLICGEAEHELSELKRLCNSVVALIDSERKNPGEEVEARRRDFSRICGTLGIDCKVLDRRAMENYFPAAAIAKAFPNHSYRELEHYERLGETRAAWGKTDNWRVASEMTRDELLATDLGRFLEGI